MQLHSIEGEKIHSTFFEGWNYMPQYIFSFRMDRRDILGNCCMETQIFNTFCNSMIIIDFYMLFMYRGCRCGGDLV
jgi:hypothetical protein